MTKTLQGAARLILWAALFCPFGAAAQTIKIGVHLVATDPDDWPQLRAARMAADEINAAGGVLGKKLEIVPAYSQTRDYAKAQGAVQGLIKRGVPAILMTGGSQMVLKASEITIANDVVLMASSASSPHITNLTDKKLIWRTIPSDVYQGKIAASLVNPEKHKTAGVMYLNNAYGIELSRAFRDAFEKRGGKVVSFMRYPDTESYKNYNFRSALDSLYKQRPDVVYLISYVEDGIEILKQTKKYNFVGADYKPLFLGCDGNYNNDFLLGVDAEFLESMMGLAYTHPKNSKNYEKFIAKFRNYAPAKPDSAEVANSSLAALLDVESTNSFAATSYDGVYALACAMLAGKSAKATDIAANLRRISLPTQAAQTINVGEFAQALAALKAGKEINYEGASGAVDFDANGDVTGGTYIVWRVSQGRFVEAQTVSFP